MAEAPQLKIELSLSKNVLSNSSSEVEGPILTVTTTLLNLPILTLDNRGERDASTVLGSCPVEMRGELFSYIETQSGQEIPMDDEDDWYPGSCVTHSEPPQDHMTELHQGIPNVVSLQLHPRNVFADPVRKLKNGHEYRFKLRPQSVRAWRCGVEELIAKWRTWGEKNWYEEWNGRPHEREPEFIMVSLESSQEPLFQVEK